jgi:hypothetical protein
LQVGYAAAKAAAAREAAVVGSQLHVLRVGDVCEEAPNIGVEPKGVFRLHQTPTAEEVLFYGLVPRIEWN